MDIIPTKALQNTKEKVDFKCTDFKSYKSKPKQPKFAAIPGQQKSTELLDLKRTKHEVIKFTNSAALSYGGKSRAEIAASLAISLGAKAAKKEYRNYKDIIVENKTRRQNVDRQTQLQQIGKNAQGSASQKYLKIKSAKQKKLLNKPIVTNYGVVKPKLGIKKRRNK